jgi:hypothetical protein
MFLALRGGSGPLPRPSTAWLQSAALKIGLPAEMQWDQGLTPRR